VSDCGPRTLDRRTSKRTSPDALRPCGLYITPKVGFTDLAEQKVIYDLLFRASAETLLEVARDPRHCGAEIGFFTVLHTWSQKLGLHPHVHCVIPAGGLSLDHNHWIKSRDRFFLPIHVLRRVFRGKLVAALRQAFRDHQLVFHGNLTPLAQPRTFAAWLRPLFRKDWVVYSKPPFGGPEYVLQYLGRYTHRVAISNHRLVSFDEGKVTFRWRDSAHNNEQKLLTLSLDEFLRRFLLHVLPKGFVRIRNFGFLANRRRATLLPLCFHLLGSAPQTEQDISGSKDSSDFWLCPKCGGPMMVIERLTVPRSNFVLLRPWSPRPHETTLYHKKSLRVSAHSLSLRLAVPQTAPFYFLKSCLGESFALSSPFHPPLSPVVLCRTASAQLDTAPSLN